MLSREEVLSTLYASEEPLSGEALAQRLNVTRAAVWKVIEQLREEGFQIEAHSRQGYILRPEGQPVSAVGIRRYLNGNAMRGNIEVYDTIDSTNRRAKALAAEGAPEGTLVVARAQEAGHGRFQRAFHSPKDLGAYFSLILRPKWTAERAVLLTALTAVAMARAIERVAPVEIAIKWVNDLYIGNKKVCGILCEAGMDFESAQMDYVVAGIGVNIARQEFPEAIQSIATSIGNETDLPISADRVIAETINELSGMRLNDADAVMAEYRARSNVIGRRIRVLRGDDSIPALAVDIDMDGSLIVETAAGRQTLRSGEISIRWEDGL